jgi:NAD(P)-dependent dehydrogenase (short-subunit alcohol dehydrogenase family)/GNAT superfamily N-acetyltransferase
MATAKQRSSSGLQRGPGSRGAGQHGCRGGQGGPIEIRPAADDDCEFAYQVKKAAEGELIRRFFGWDEVFQRGFHMREWVERRPGIIRFEGKAIGTVDVREGDGCIDIGRFFIQPEYQNRGIGSSILRQVTRRADEGGLVARLAFLRGNRAEALYGRHGFRLVGQTETHCHMERRPGAGLGRGENVDLLCGVEGINTHGSEVQMGDRVAVVTGASSGLGLSISGELLGQGIKVVGVARRQRSESAELGGGFTLVLGDVALDETAEEAFNTAAALGANDILVNCAGAGVFGSAGTNTRADLDRVLAGSLLGTILFSEQAVKRFTSGGTIMNVMSTAALVGRADESIYCASKWGARGYTESIRAELKGRGIRVMAAYVGGMNTPFWSEAQGSTTDCSKFMDPGEVACMIVAAILDSGSGYVSDLTINRT